MSSNKSIDLGDHFNEFIKSEVSSGRYDSAREVIKSGLRILEVESKKIKAINEALAIGEVSGPPVEFNNNVFVNKMKQKLSSDA